MERVLDVEPAWETYREDLAFLSDFAITFRYLGKSADREAALDARRPCCRFRRAARNAMALDTRTRH